MAKAIEFNHLDKTNLSQEEILWRAENFQKWSIEEFGDHTKEIYTLQFCVNSCIDAAIEANQ